MAHPNGKKRLLVLASTFPARLDDGVPAFVYDIAEQEAEDFEVTVLTPRVPGAATRETMGAVTVIRFPYFPRRWEDLADGAILDNLRARRSRWLQVVPLLIGQMRAIRREVARSRPDAIHAHWVIPQGMSAVLVAPSVPLLVTTHGGDIYALNNAIFGRIKRRVLRTAKAVTTVNAEMISRLEEWGVDEAKLSLLPMGVPLDQAAEAKAGAVQVPGRLLVVGRLVEKKGIGVLLDALRNNVDAEGWSLVIVGDGPIRAELEAASAGLPVEFRGQQSREEVLGEMAAASVLVLPSVSAASGDQEGLPVVLLEAAAMGSAIVASDLPGINEALTNEKNGLLVPQRDAAALGRALTRLLGDTTLRERLGAAALERADDYSLARIGAGYRAVVAGISSPGMPNHVD